MENYVKPIKVAPCLCETGGKKHTIMSISLTGIVDQVDCTQCDDYVNESNSETGNIVKDWNDKKKDQN